MLSKQEKSRSTAWKIAGAAASVLAIGAMLSQSIGQADVREFPEETAPAPAPVAEAAEEDIKYGLIAESNWQSVLRVSAMYGDNAGFAGLAAQTQENAESAYDNEDLYEVASLAGYILGESDSDNAAVTYGSHLYEAMTVNAPTADVAWFQGLMTDGASLSPADVQGKRLMLAGESSLYLRLAWFATIPTYYASDKDFTDGQESRFYEVCGLEEDACDRVLKALRRDARLSNHLADVFDDTEAADIAEDDQLNLGANKAAIAYAERKSYGVIGMEYMFIYAGVGSVEKMGERVGLAAKIAGAEDKKGRERGVTVDVLSALSGQSTELFDAMYTKGQGYTEVEEAAAITALKDFSNIESMSVFLLPLGGGGLSCAERSRFSDYCEQVVLGDFEDDDDADAYCDKWMLTFNRARRVQRVYRRLFREVME